MFGYLKSHINLNNVFIHETMAVFQPVLGDPARLAKVKDHHFRFHHAQFFLLSLMLLMDSIVQYSVHGFGIHNEHAFHQIIANYYSDFFKKQAEIVFCGLLFLTFFCFGLLLFDRFDHVDFILLADNGKVPLPYRKGELKTVPEVLGQKLLRFYNPYRKFINLMIPSMYFQGSLAFSIPLLGLEMYKILSTSGQYLPNFRVAITMIGSFFYVRSGVCVFHIAIQFIFQCFMINVKQKHYVREIERVQLRIELPGKKRIKRLKCGYRECRKVMVRLLDLTRELNQFNRFYSKYVTMILIVFGAIGCSTINAATRNRGSEPVILLIPWLFYSAVYILIILLFTSIGSRIILFNVQLFNRLRQLQMRLLSANRSNLKVSQVVRLDLVNEYKLLLQKTSFRLMNAAALNNKLFAFQIFSYASVFYLKLIADD